jgi:hypothetical protein
MGGTLRTATRNDQIAGPGVIGLDLGREAARRAQRRKRRHDRVVSLLLAAVAAGLIGVAGWFGYQTYVDHQAQREQERDRRTAEIERERSGEGVEDVIEDLEESPKWNGPGNPSFGVGEDTVAP